MQRPVGNIWRKAVGIVLFYTIPPTIVVVAIAGLLYLGFGTC